ncbi:Hypothetical protein NTJ_14304 [Nesidiocoris tenuis]|uniref:Uncharacterized protein n=1 Tax=Nesidiocoris tenuis TaxID=355587 RepID=A0ABN7BAR3_9HEMI|nr:Hypothetical protein NTJ_14304 [Nesidiocoris tenuis]
MGLISGIVLTNIQYYQMNNIWLMIDVSLKCHPYILLWGFAAIHTYDLCRALSDLDSHIEDLRYIKYIHPEIPAETYNSTSIKKLASIAKAIVKPLVTMASKSNLAWADFIKEVIMPSKGENDAFFETLYSYIPEPGSKNNIRGAQE